jgi:uncharacterized protein YggE
MRGHWRRVGMLAAVVASAAALATGGVFAASRSAPPRAGAQSGPDLTVVGFGLATGSASGYQLSLNFQMSNANLARSISDMQAAVRHAAVKFEGAGIPASHIEVQPLGINDSPKASIQVTDGLSVSLTSLKQVAAVQRFLTSGALLGVNNYYLSSNYQPSISPGQLRAAYRVAWRNAEATARAMAAAQGLTLGNVVSESEGQAAANCAGGGYCPVVNYQGALGPNQTLEPMTVTFATSRAG